MGYARLLSGGGGGVPSKKLTGYASQALAGYTFGTRDSNNKPIAGTLPLGAVLATNGGTIPSKSSGDSTISGNVVTVPSGYYSSPFTKTVGTARSDSGNVKLTAANPSTSPKSYPAGYYANAHGAYVDVFTW